MRLRTLYEIQFWTTFIWSFFQVIRIFGNIEPKIDCNMPFLYNIIFQPYESFTTPSFTRAGLDICACRLFCTKFNAKQLSFEVLFLWWIFLAALSSKLNVICRFSTILYFNHINLSRPLAPLQGGDRRMRSHTFCTKFNSEQLSFGAFFDVMWTNLKYGVSASTVQANSAIISILALRI